MMPFALTSPPMLPVNKRAFSPSWQSEATEMMELKDQGMQMALEQSKKAIDTRNEVTVLSTGAPRS